MESPSPQIASFILQTAREEFASSNFDEKTFPTVELIEKNLATPKDEELADICLPAFVFAKSIKSKPDKIAADIARALHSKIAAKHASAPDYIAHVESVSNFINFKYTAAFHARVLPLILDGTFLSQRPKRPERVMIEYSQPVSNSP